MDPEYPTSQRVSTNGFVDTEGRANGGGTVCRVVSLCDWCNIVFEFAIEVVGDNCNLNRVLCVIFNDI